MAFISFSNYAKHTPTALGLVQHLLILSQQHLWKDSTLRVQTEHIAATLQYDQMYDMICCVEYIMLYIMR